MSQPVLLHGKPVERPWGGSGVAELGMDVPTGKTIGEWWIPTDVFPLLVKIIDARENLSVQLHPDDELAAEVGLPNGKTESWYVLRADPGARILLGLEPDVEKDDFFDRADSGDDVSPLLSSIAPATGDVIYVPAGTIHAIGAGVVVLEVQQVSDTTYRVFDWNRKPARPLHLKEARRALRDDPEAGLTVPERPRSFGNATVTSRLKCPLFEIEEISLSTQADLPPEGGGPSLLFCIEGRLTISTHETPVDLDTGKFCLLTEPESVHLSPSAAARVLRIRPT